MFIERERDRERERNGYAGCSLLLLLLLQNGPTEFKFTRSVVFVSEVRRRYRLAGGRIIFRTSSCIRWCRTASELKHPLMLCVYGKDRLCRVVEHTTTK